MGAPSRRLHSWSHRAFAGMRAFPRRISFVCRHRFRTFGLQPVVRPTWQHAEGALWSFCFLKSAKQFPAASPHSSATSAMTQPYIRVVFSLTMITAPPRHYTIDPRVPRPWCIYERFPPRGGGPFARTGKLTRTPLPLWKLSGPEPPHARALRL